MPTAGLEVITYRMPLDFHIKSEAALGWWRTRHHTKLQQKVMTTSKPSFVDTEKYPRAFWKYAVELLKMETGRQLFATGQITSI